ncbi:MAG: hypothetical protein A4E65_02120 [Syntrophorhabdus sp. PtaU1.Bin153]|nr:MAG: hypothetical protein A4E65_02120 [Syntrophorhabdus sp. PtaU1.Bin153]
MVLSPALEPVFSDIFRVIEGVINVAPLNMASYIQVPFNALVDLRGAFLDRIERFIYCIENLIFHIDQIQGLLRNLFGHGSDSSNWLSYVANLVHRKNLFVAKFFVASPYALFYPKGILS